MCYFYGVSKSGYYAWRQRQPSTRELENNALLKEIKRYHRQSKETYGSPRITAKLKAIGYNVGRHRVARIMRENDIQAKMYKRFVANPGSHAFYDRFPNRLLHQPLPNQPNQVWVADFTHIRIHTYPVYLAVVMDLSTRQIIGWTITKRRTAKMTCDALAMAIKQRRPKAGTIFHSDRGIEYAAYRLSAILSEHGMVQSMSRKGNCYDNAYMESFFGSLKSEMVYCEKLTDYVQTRCKLINYIKYYNQERLHSSLNFQSPNNYERLCA